MEEVVRGESGGGGGLTFQKAQGGGIYGCRDMGDVVKSREKKEKRKYLGK